VVAGREAGLIDAVRDGETGLLVDPYNPAAVADGLNRLLSDSALRQRMGKAGRRAVETYFNWDRVVRDIEDIEASCDPRPGG
jgi:glycosyltransferase involved in cell wall biosynthesis